MGLSHGAMVRVLDLCLDLVCEWKMVKRVEGTNPAPKKLFFLLFIYLFIFLIFLSHFFTKKCYFMCKYS